MLTSALVKTYLWSTNDGKGTNPKCASKTPARYKTSMWQKRESFYFLCLLITMVGCDY